MAAEQPFFYFDLGSPYAWLAAERIQQVLPVTAVWQPILLGGIWKQTGGRSWATTAAGARSASRARWAPRGRPFTVNESMSLLLPAFSSPLMKSQTASLLLALSTPRSMIGVPQCR